MFDIGFTELALVGVVALLVIGPERLPLVARKVGMWVGKARRFISHVQSDFKQEVDKAEELKRLMEEQSKIQSFHEIIEHGGEDDKGRVPAERLPHKAKTFSDSSASTSAAASTEASENPVKQEAAVTTVTTVKRRAEPVAVAGSANSGISNLSEDHDKAK